jgi:hypothetical protein
MSDRACPPVPAVVFPLCSLVSGGGGAQPVRHLLADRSLSDCRTGAAMTAGSSHSSRTSNRRLRTPRLAAAA